MNDAPTQPGRPRRAFLEPPPRVPFLKTREGRLIAGLGVLCLLGCIALFFQYRRAQAAIARATAERTRAEAQAAAAPTLPLEERLAQKRVDLTAIYEGAFADTANGDDFLETAGYAKLIELLASMSPEEVAAKAHKYLDHAQALEYPDLQRGEFVRVRGLIGGMFAVKLERPVHDITDVWRATIVNPDLDRYGPRTDPQSDRTEGVVFDFIGEPPKFELQRSVVEVDGLMYRTVRFENRKRELQTAPYLLSRSIRLIEAASPSGRSSKFWAILVGMVAIIGYLMLRSALRSNRRRGDPPTRIKAMFQERLRARREHEL